MKEFLKELYQYNHRMNEKVALLLYEHERELPPRAMELFSHVLNAHDIWNSRISGTGDAPGVWELRPAEKLKHEDRINFENSMTIIENSDLARKVTYKNLKGEQYVNTVRDMLFHVINHSTYHRAQIAGMVSAAGITPPVTDFIAYKRRND